ncbi:zinc finger protein 479-like isoform X1 [Pogonomyrmex barbatus]|uniref:Zinc finger protein 479-like isoform X1 n=1 Tax=Pogonomyrmex barbatus TaxID=144034 RepID=A0A6I9WFT0_9HYME|nr:zinc finger protein 479-like isoform X1 [Pogonomyrmex barbatus]
MTTSHARPRTTMTEPELCRLCAETKENLIGIYDAEGQKLAIEAKIAKCLQIQVLITDGLPLTICIDCCDLLNQCSEFFEKTNQAQISLRQLLIDPKSEPQSIEPNIDYVEESIEFSKNEVNNREEIVQCQLPGNYINETVNILNTSYFIEGCNKNENTEIQEIQDNTKQKKCKIQIKKSSPKQAKKKLKKKGQMQKVEEESELHIASQIDKEQNNTTLNDNIEIVDNYIPVETESNLEIRDTRTVETTKHGRKKTEGLERYPWLCTDCNDKLPSLEALEEHHETVHNQQAKYMCVKCCKVYDKYYGFLTHVKRHKNKAKFSCEDCGKSFVHKKVLDSHKTVHSEERPFVCQTCGKAFRQQSALCIHNRCHLPETMKNRFPCDQCDKRFSTKPNLVTHKRIHSGVRNFTCDQCGKSFIQKGNLEAHFLTHSPDKPYNCSQCTKAFKTPLQLKKHETVHTGAKPHQCAVCGRTFREKGTLREHHRIHTGAMPFTCEFCGKCFRFKGILTTHRRQHTGERPYSCLECQHHFTNWPNYNKHMKRRHGINTSHTKHLTNNQQLQQQQPTEQTQPSQIQQQSSGEDPLSIPQTESTTVQVIQAVPHVSASQPIVIQTIPTTIQTFQTDVTNTVQETVFRDRNTYFNTVPALQNFLPANLPYNFYSIPNVTENDLIQHR